ncbi:MAG TPA: SDR family NAD(P)-dependent oxidoreductase [Gaiellaceae bacterium]|nr:SDR family NAD(P)-dependent oxidoreductase [Gaiellaceae bacterium]
MRGLESLRVLVTGAAGGIGTAVTERLVAEGARVAAADLQAPGGVAEASVGGDVTDEDGAARVVEEAHAALGGLDGLVLTAGIHYVGPTHEMAAADFDRVLAVSARGTFLCLRAALPVMLQQRSGRIVTYGSTAALVGAPGLTAYAAAKGAVLQITRSVAAEYASQGIRVNCLCPGATDTPLLRRLMADRPDPEHFAQAHPIGRFADADEIAAATAFLLSDDASYFIGSAVVCDGGFTAV